MDNEKIFSGKPLVARLTAKILQKVALHGLPSGEQLADLEISSILLAELY